MSFLFGSAEDARPRLREDAVESCLGAEARLIGSHKADLETSFLLQNLASLSLLCSLRKTLT